MIHEDIHNIGHNWTTQMPQKRQEPPKDEGVRGIEIGSIESYGLVGRTAVTHHWSASDRTPKLDFSTTKGVQKPTDT